MNIVDTPEKDVSNVDSKVDKRKLRKSLIKSSLSLFSCLIRAMCNRFYRAQNKHLTLKTFIPEINTSISPYKHDENIFSETLINELHAWIENYPGVTHPPTAKDSVFVNINGTLIKKQNHLL